MSKSQMQEFDTFAKDYRNLHNENMQNLSEFGSEYYSEYKIEIVKNSLKNSPKNILDFGCGDGKSCEFLSKYFPEALITGIDISPASIEEAKNKQIQNCSFMFYDGEKLPYENCSFDVIFVACVFHHIEKQNHQYLIEELKRTLKKDGKLFIFEHNPINPLTQKVVKDCVFDQDAKLIFPAEMKNAFIRAGFKSPKISYTLFFPRFNLFKKFFFLEKHLKWFFVGAQYYIEALKIN